MTKVTVAYEHDPADLQAIYLAVSPRQPVDDDWKPALRDTVNGRRVVWARFDTVGTTWLRDSNGTKRVRPL